jgi:hypothetical protein
MRLTSAKQIPASVQRCAQEQSLGTPRILYEPPQASRLSFFIGPFAILIGVLIIAAYNFLYSTIFSWWPSTQSFLVLFIGLTWLAIGSWIILPALITPRVRIFLCPKGLIYIRRRMDVVRWDRIEQFWKTSKLDKQAHASYTFTIRRNDGVLFLLKDDLPYVERLGGFLEREIVRQLLTRTIDDFEKGQVLQFGAIHLTSSGILLTHEHKLLPWDDVERVDIEDMTLSIGSEGDDWDWATINISGIPNIGLFKAVVEHVIYEPDEPVLSTDSLSQALPAQIVAYNAGFSIFFGALCINKAGISFDNSDEQLPWSEIASFAIGESELMVRRHGSLNDWYTLPLWKISDLPALRELIDYMLRGQVS